MEEKQQLISTAKAAKVWVASQTEIDRQAQAYIVGRTKGGK